MKRITLIIILLFLTTILQSCLKNDEKLTPQYESKSLIGHLNKIESKETAKTGQGDSFQPDSPIEETIITDDKGEQLVTARMKYYIRNINFNDNEKPSSMISLKNILETITKNLASIIMRLGGNFDLTLDPLSISIPEDIDLQKVVGLRITKTHFDIRKNEDSVVPESQNIKFLNSGDIFLSSREIEDDIARENEGAERELILSYDKEKNQCNFKCLNFDVQKVNILKYAKKYREVMIVPSISIGDAPDQDLILDGYVEVLVTMKMKL